MDINLIILALETLQEQVSDAMSVDEQAEDRERFNRIKREIELFKAEQLLTCLGGQYVHKQNTRVNR